MDKMDDNDRELILWLDEFLWCQHLHYNEFEDYDNDHDADDYDDDQ